MQINTLTWAMAYEDEDQFVKALLAGQPEAPFYFATMKKLNKVERTFLTGLPQPARLSIAELKQVLDQGAVVVDTRSPDEFAAGHIPGTINLPLDNSFTNWAGWLLDYDQPFYLITNETTLRPAIGDLIYIGLDHLAGYVDPSILAVWPGELQSYPTTTPAEIADQVLRGEVTVLDVRALSEWNEGHLPGAKHMMLGYLPKRLVEIPTGKPVLVHCQTQSRSAIGASVLQAQGLPNVIKMQTGYEGWAAAGLPIECN